ncbi:MAG: SGNH/GDSL hydrolase family protein, partial [Planctomycetota bacterium]|nr:SGNH/GDSL hydrolase family protein [Planctomycetota bacterium]
MTDSKTQSPPQIKLSLTRKLAFSLVTVLLFFTILEVGLRVAGLGEAQVIGELHFGYNTGVPKFDEDGIEQEGEPYNLPLFEEDDELFWKPIGPTRFTGMHGFRRPEPQTKSKPSDTFRFVVLGDSCSFLGKSPYPNEYARLLSERIGSPVDFANVSCPGYTTYQGRLLVDSIWEWNPDLLIVYFGWTDHRNSR